MLLLSACGRQTKDEYKIVNGHIVYSGDEETSPSDSAWQENVTFEQAVTGAGVTEGSDYSEGTAVSSENDSGSKTGRSAVMKEDMNAAADACRDIYANADKGGGINVTLSAVTVGEMMSAIAGLGYSVCDSTNSLNMMCYEPLDAFGKSIGSKGSINGQYFTVYNDGHLSLFQLYRDNDIWYLLSMSGAWNEDNSLRIVSEGRYAVDEVKYTAKGWLVYRRDTSDYDENQKSNTDAYTMIRVLPYDSELRMLAARYVEPIGYLENNLFITDWSSPNFGPIDFNTLYAYLFGMYNGTEMLSSYNIRSYYKSIGGSRLYLIPAETFETTVQNYFEIDSSTLKAISDYSWSRGGYLFLGYNRDYYNVTPRTPEPEVVGCADNGDGTITLTVDAVNYWYGTDCAFRHYLTVRPENGGFKYIANTLVQSENNILPEQKLAAMTDVEISKLS